MVWTLLSEHSKRDRQRCMWRRWRNKNNAASTTTTTMSSLPLFNFDEWKTQVTNGVSISMDFYLRGKGVNRKRMLMSAFVV